MHISMQLCRVESFKNTLDNLINLAAGKMNRHLKLVCY